MRLVRMLCSRSFMHPLITSCIIQVVCLWISALSLPSPYISLSLHSMLVDIHMILYTSDELHRDGFRLES